MVVKLQASAIDFDSDHNEEWAMFGPSVLWIDSCAHSQAANPPFGLMALSLGKYVNYVSVFEELNGRT